MGRLVRMLVSQDRAVANARSASTALSRQRLEREEVELFLERHARRHRRTA
jgi:hypothetical protein